MPRVIAAGLVGMLLGMLLGGLLGGLPLFGIAQGDIRQPGEQVVARVVRVVDGDTFRATITDWPKVVGENIPVRVAGVDAPEPRGKCQAEKDLAEAARAFLEALIGPGKQVVLLRVRRDNFFRLIAEVRVWIDGGWVNVGDALIRFGHARPYTKGQRVGWCDGGDGVTEMGRGGPDRAF